MTTAKEKYHHGDLRSALLEAALAVLNEIGPQGLTIREVARRAGVSHAAPYRHFTDKDELVLAVVEQGFELMQETMRAEKAAVPDDPLNQFAASGLAYVNFALEHPAHYRVMFSGDLLSSTGQVSLQHTSRAALQEMVSNITECQHLGVVREGDPVTQALTILSTIHGFVSLVNDNRIEHLIVKPSSLESIRDAVLTMIFEGLGSREAAKD
ncbi:MAG: TetR/AcrR family transcriptional regulator [Halioglobus sp.]|nr:TetR/AcrR family transcriptional regulator [Halioglobus sp.]